MSLPSIAVVILAAGASSRMGRPKLLLPWGDTSVLGHLIHQWRRLNARQIALVCASGDERMNRELDRLGVAASDRIINPSPERGMFSSIQCAARWDGWQRGLTHWAIVLGDQPHLQAVTLLALIGFAVAHPGRVCQPGRHGRPRHPVLLPEAVLSRLKSSDAATLKQFLQQQNAAVCDLDDPGLDFDLDTPADYERARRIGFVGDA
jgi:molybdenum cofactor cytidylyltransferase